jgi:carboxynorspermidine decarboxylase
MARQERQLIYRLSRISKRKGFLILKVKAMALPKTPYYLIDERRLLRNLKRIKYISRQSGAKCVLALKCFAAWNVFGLIGQYMDGTTSSSPYEARLGHEKFGKEVHAYSVAYKQSDIAQLKRFACKIIFNSVSQLKMFYPALRRSDLGLRINPGISYSRYSLADPARRFSRLGVINRDSIRQAMPYIKGLMFHFNCENHDFKNLSANMDYIADRYGAMLKRLKWVSLGGGLYFSKKEYPVDDLCKKLKDFGRRFDVQVYLEPGESVVAESTELVCTVLDIVRNRMDIAIVDASAEAHMPDLLIYATSAKIDNNEQGPFRYMIAGRSCLAGDIFGTFSFKKRLRPGSIVRFQDAGGYTMVKKNWFNGLPMPSIAVKRLDGKTGLIRKFSYKDFVDSLS